MPMLQIDGVAIAEIDQATANLLLNYAKLAIGKAHQPAEFLTQVHVMPRRGPSAVAVVDLKLDFQIPP
jgi:hypothetical protein